jgi:hypothetical protein
MPGAIFRVIDEAQANPPRADGGGLPDHGVQRGMTRMQAPVADVQAGGPGRLRSPVRLDNDCLVVSNQNPKRS